jgi:predicted Rossmann-fold nucleotide-binding protein
VLILDPHGAFAPLVTLLDHLEAEGFVKPGQRELVTWCTSVEQVIETLNKSGK